MRGLLRYSRIFSKNDKFSFRYWIAYEFQFIWGDTALFVFISGFLFYYIFYQRGFDYKLFLKNVEKQAPSYNKDWLRLNVFWYCAFWYIPFISVVFIASPFFVFVGTTFAIDWGNVWIRDYSSNAWKLQFKFNDGEKCRDYCDATVCEADYPKKVNNGWQCCCSKRFE